MLLGSRVPVIFKVLYSIGYCAAVLSFGGCQTDCVSASAERQKIAGKLSTIDPKKDPLPASTRIIDIHTHTFNARYLPLEGVLLGKRDAFFPITTLISDQCAKVIAQGLIDRTSLAAAGEEPKIKPVATTAELRAREKPGLLCDVFLGLIDKAIAKGAWSGSDVTEGRWTKESVERKMRILDSLADEMNPPERLAVLSAAKMMGMDEHVRGAAPMPETVSGIKAAVRFLWAITQNDAGMTNLYRAMHQGAPKNGEITMVSHMMDLGPVYAQNPDGKNLLDFRTQQVRRMERYQRDQSNLLYFVAYNPYRGGAGDPALDLVRDAILHHGAKGVKVYPPSGYRPAGNQVLPRPLAFLSAFPGREWDARYRQFGGDQNGALDKKLNDLLEWCIREDVPVFVHSGYGEFEARKGYGVHNSSPEYWGRFLAAHSTPGHPCPLRLCLGHAGGGDYWFGQGNHPDWGQKAYELCTQYPNVYCEITTDESIIRPDTQAFFVERVASLCEQSAPAAAIGAAGMLDPKTSRRPRYPFASKLMYGTDWFLPDRGEPESVLRHTEQAFLHPRLRHHYADYFYRNARRYLKMYR